jgi:hypothetical protein
MGLSEPLIVLFETLIGPSVMLSLGPCTFLRCNVGSIAMLAEEGGLARSAPAATFVDGCSVAIPVAAAFFCGDGEWVGEGACRWAGFADGCLSVTVGGGGTAHAAVAGVVAPAPACVSVGTLAAPDVGIVALAPAGFGVVVAVPSFAGLLPLSTPLCGCTCCVLATANGTADGMPLAQDEPCSIYVSLYVSGELGFMFTRIRCFLDYSNVEGVHARAFRVFLVRSS